MQYKSDRVVDEAFNKELKKVNVTQEQVELLERFFRAGVDAAKEELKELCKGVLERRLKWPEK